MCIFAFKECDFSFFLCVIFSCIRKLIFTNKCIVLRIKIVLLLWQEKLVSSKYILKLSFIFSKDTLLRFLHLFLNSGIN